MFAKLRPSSAYDVMAALALFLVVAGGGAYAAATITGADVVDESLTGADVKGKQGTASAPAANGTLTGADIAGQAANAANGTPFVQGSLGAVDVQDNSLRTEDIRDGSVKVDDLAAGASKSVVARARGSSTVTTTSSEQDYPLTGSAWTQAANESDELFGEITYASPACFEPGEFLVVRAYVAPGVQPVAEQFLPPVTNGGTDGHTEPLFSETPTTDQFTLTNRPVVFEPGQPVDRDLSVTVEGECGGEPFSVTSVKLNVSAMR